MEDFRAPAHRLGHVGRTDRHQHELLHVDAVVRVGAPVEHVDHRHRQPVRTRTAELPVQGNRLVARRGVGAGHRCGQDRIGPETALVGGAVQLDHPSVHGLLIVRVHAEQGLLQFSINVCHCRAHTFPAKAVRFAIAEFECLAGTGRSAGRHGRAARHASRQEQFGLDQGRGLRRPQGTLG